MPYDPALADSMRAALGHEESIREQRMFGGICWMLNGNMLCGAEVGRYMFRVGKEQEAEALMRPGSQPVAFAGRRMGGFVWVDAQACSGSGLLGWIDFAKGHVLELSAK